MIDVSEKRFVHEKYIFLIRNERGIGIVIKIKKMNLNAITYLRY